MAIGMLRSSKNFDGRCITLMSEQTSRIMVEPDLIGKDYNEYSQDWL